MTFLSGFAEGYLTERKARKEREQDLDDQSFQYRMKFLTDQRDKREAKKLKEVEVGKQSQLLAEQLGDPSAASTFYKEISNGVSYETAQKRIAEGHYKKNDKYVQPTQTIKVPGAVSMEDPLAQFPKNERVDARIDAIDPNIRAPITEQDDFSILKDDPGNPYVFKPNNEFELKSWDQVEYDLLLAEKSKDPEKLAEAKLAMKAHTLNYTRKAMIEAQQKGENAKLFIFKDPKTGEMKSTFTGEIREDGSLWNTSNPTVDGNGNTGTQVTAEEMGTVQQITPEALEEMVKLEDNFGKQSVDLKEGQASFVGALNTSKKIIELINEDERVTTKTAGAVEFVNDLSQEVYTAYSVVVGNESEIKKKIESGDMTGIQKLIVDQEQNIEDMISQSRSAGGIMGDDNKRLASNRAIYESLRNLAAYQMAAANGVSGQNLSDKDFQKFYNMIGGDKPGAANVFRALQNSTQTVLTTLDTKLAQINGHPSIKGFKGRHKFNPGVEVPRIEDLLIQSGREDLLPTFKQINGKLQVEKAIAAESATQNTLESDPEMGGIPAGAVEKLRNNPSLKEAFDEKYGPGSAAQILGE